MADKNRSIAEIVALEGVPAPEKDAENKSATQTASDNARNVTIHASGNVYYTDGNGQKHTERRRNPRRRRTAEQRSSNTPKSSYQKDVAQRFKERRHELRRKIDLIDWSLDRAVRLLVPIILIAWALWIRW